MLRRLLLVVAVLSPAPPPVAKDAVAQDAAQDAVAQRAIAVFSQTVPLDPRDPRILRAGALEYRGGIALRSTDPRFGGFSGVHVSADGASLLAVSDRGAWLRLGLRYDRAGRLIGAAAGEIGALIGENGKVLNGGDADAEALAVMPDGSILVAFERRHRILHYPEASPPFSKPPASFPLPGGMERAPANGGLEALTHVGRGFFVAIAERVTAGGGAVAAWVGRGGLWEPLAYVRKPGMRVTDMALLPRGDLLVLEHRYSAETGSIARLVRVARNLIAPHRRVEGQALAELEPPLSTDNFEAVAVRRGAPGEALIYLLSDDNFNPLQRTLLLMFAIKEESPPANPPR